MSKDKIITKASFARELGVSKSRISQLVSSGLPVTVEGLIDRRAALEWIERSVLPPNRGGKVKSDGVRAAALNLLARDDAAGGVTADVRDRRDAKFQHVRNISVTAGSIGNEVGSVLVAHGIGGARELADEIVAAVLRGTAKFADDLVADGEIPAPPRGVTRWADHPWFAPEPIPDVEWDEIAANG